MTTARDAFFPFDTLPPPQIVEDIDVDAITASRVAAIQADVPDWDADPTDPVYRAVENATYRESTLRQYFNSRARQLLLRFSSGSNLDHLASLAGVSRATNETDTALRNRIPLAFAAQGVGTEAAVQSQALFVEPSLTDVQLVLASNNQDATVYLVGEVDVDADTLPGVVTTAQLARVQARLDDPTIKPIWSTYTAAVSTPTEYNVQLAITYDALRYDFNVLLPAIETSVYQFIKKNARFNHTITTNGIIAAAHVSGVTSVSLTNPSSDIAGVSGQTHTCYLKRAANAGNSGVYVSGTAAS